MIACNPGRMLCQNNHTFPIAGILKDFYCFFSSTGMLKKWGFGGRRKVKTKEREELMIFVGFGFFDALFYSFSSLTSWHE